MDEGISRIHEALQTANLLDDCLIVIMSDNGGEVISGASNYPLRGEKFTYFNGGINTPGINLTTFLSIDVLRHLADIPSLSRHVYCA